MKLHLVALPHVRLGTPWTKLCAFSGKVENFCKMMQDEYEIFVYAPESDPIPRANVTLIPCCTDAQRLATFGPDDPNALPKWPTDEQFAPFNLAVIEELKKRLAPDDLILLTACWSSLPIAQAFPGHLRCEPFIGMDGVIGGDVWGAYESATHMAATYQRNNVQNIRAFDTVIPPFYDPVEFPDVNQKKGDYLLFIGRLVYRKGPHIAAQIADACELPLVVAGAGALSHSSIKVVAPEVTITGKELIYVGPVDAEKRAELISRAIAMMVPTTYREPGGNVAIEAMACGTPPICSNFGVFTETVPKGFLFRTLKEAVTSVELAKKMSKKDHKELRKQAFESFSLPVIKEQFKHWFENIATLRGKGWYTL
jgi:glycosyltransferase involved in cell wall biosynthesis